MRMNKREQEQNKKSKKIEIHSNKIRKDDSFEEFTYKWDEIKEEDVDLLKKYVDKKIKVYISQEDNPGENGHEFLEGKVNGILKGVEVNKIVLSVESEEGEHNQYGLGKQEISYKEVTVSKDDIGWSTYSINKIEIIGENTDFLFFDCKI